MAATVAGDQGSMPAATGAVGARGGATGAAGGGGAGYPGPSTLPPLSLGTSWAASRSSMSAMSPKVGRRAGSVCQQDSQMATKAGGAADGKWGRMPERNTPLTITSRGRPGG